MQTTLRCHLCLLRHAHIKTATTHRNQTPNPPNPSSINTPHTFTPILKPRLFLLRFSSHPLSLFFSSFRSLMAAIQGVTAMTMLAEAYSSCNSFRSKRFQLGLIKINSETKRSSLVVRSDERVNSGLNLGDQGTKLISNAVGTKSKASVSSATSKGGPSGGSRFRPLSSILLSRW